MNNDKSQKQAIMEAATQLFARFGLEKTTMDDIAKAAKKGKSTLYYYFDSKEKVFAEVMRKEIAEFKNAIQQAIEKDDDPAGKLKAFVLTRLSYLNERADQYITIKDEYLKHHRFIENLAIDFSNWEITTIREIVEFGCEKGIFDLSNTVEVARAIYLALKGLEYPWMFNIERTDVTNSINVLMKILLRGISKK